MTLLYDIKQVPSPNFESRQTYKPIMIVNHITDGQGAVRSSDAQEEMAVQNTFMSRNSCCSAHFDVLRDGRIKQFVDIQNDAWTQGLGSHFEIQKSTSPIVRNMDVNPNLYCVSIEFEAYADHGGDGAITEAQFWAGVWLHKWIQTEVQRIYGNVIPLNNTFNIGHCHVDPVYRKFDPGVNFPWARIYAENAIANSMSLADYEGRLSYLSSDQYKVNQAFGIAQEITYLYNLTKGSDGAAEWAKSILLGLQPVMTKLGLCNKPYDAVVSLSDVYNEVLYLYNTGQNKNGAGIWAQQQLLTLYPYMLSQGLVKSA
jgi:N-acetylmuramoyl-L-alanine amidase